MGISLEHFVATCANILFAAQHDILLIFAAGAMCTLAFLLALTFDLTNGFHDCANSIATIVASKTLTPRQAVAWAAFWNFAAWCLGTGIAEVVSKIINPAYVTQPIIACALAGAIAWNLITWRTGTPSSSSHALLGGMIGAAVIGTYITTGRVEFSQVVNVKTLTMTAAFIVISPFIGYVLGNTLTRIMRSIVKTSSPRTDKIMRRLQLVSSALYSLGHGSNDAQKTAGVIRAIMQTIAVIIGIPLWIILLCHFMMAMGTLAAGWRIVETLSKKISDDIKDPLSGVCAELSAAISLCIALLFKVPVSTTHTITAAIAGTGSATKSATVYWNRLARIAIAWVVTIPASALCASIVYYGISVLL